MRRRRVAALVVLLVVLALVFWRVSACDRGGSEDASFTAVPTAAVAAAEGDGVKIGTFLGNYSRRFYGLGGLGGS